jgi:hypothetical protein
VDDASEEAIASPQALSMHRGEGLRVFSGFGFVERGGPPFVDGVGL